IHAVVGPDIDVWGESDSEKVDPQNIECGDVLEIDIEGAELEVMKHLEERPRNIIVESHGFQGSSTESVKEILDDMQYQILNIETAEIGDFCEEKDIRVITAEIRGET
ncbi:MAG: FkbM family methyltransferase, partial [Candidatus Aenigmatarchaeota archaeon]